MPRERNIILCGGKLDPRDLPSYAASAAAMVTINGKPAIAWILDDLIAKKISSATIVVPPDDETLGLFVKRAFFGRIELSVVRAVAGGSILTSLEVGLAGSEGAELVRVILGDTLITDEYSGTESFVYTGHVTDTHRWCLVETDAAGRVVSYADKQDVREERVPVDHQFTALTGYYHFTRPELLRTCVEQALTARQRELSAVLSRYGAAEPLAAKPAQHWFDFGHADTLVDARHRLLQARSFNRLLVNPVFDTITKLSERTQKLRDEIDWYRELPPALQVLTPRLISVKENNGEVELVQEYYGYPSLAELFVYGELHPEKWSSILRRVLQVHGELRRFPGTLSVEEHEAMYVGKTFERLAAFKPADAASETLFRADEVVYNGARLKNWKQLEPSLRSRGRTLAENARTTVMHGDYCFSNILFDVSGQIVRLIDPRGRFGRKGIYGDPRYDLAKLRHSACSFYDYIVADMFLLEGTGHEYRGEIYTTAGAARVAATFDHRLTQWGDSLADIKFIEGLLFLSMLPLHDGQPRRQQLMLLTGLKLLNEVSA